MKKIITVDPAIKIRKCSDLIDIPIVVKVTKFDEDSANNFSEEFSKAHNTGQPIIPIVIDSYGGSVYSLLSMIAEIQNSKLPVATICVGKAMSCGAVLLTYGAEGHRYIDPNGTVMIHDVSTSIGGKNEEIKASVKETDRLQKQIFQMMAKNCGHADKNYFTDIIHHKSHAEWYLTPTEAKKHNIINNLKVPSFYTKISVETKFE